MDSILCKLAAYVGVWGNGLRFVYCVLPNAVVIYLFPGDEL